MIATTEIKREVAIIESEATTALSKAKKIEITTQTQYDAAADFIKTVKGLQKKVKDTFSPIVKKAHATWKEAKDQENAHLKPLEEAESIVKRASIQWFTKQEEIRIENERKARERAEADERKRKAELEAQAKKWEEKGNLEKAEERRAAIDEVYVPAAPVATVQKAEGQSIKENWKAEVTDLKALVKAVAEGKAPLNFLQADMTVINRQSKATKDSMQFPGVRFFAEKVMAVR